MGRSRQRSFLRMVACSFGARVQKKSTILGFWLMIAWLTRTRNSKFPPLLILRRHDSPFSHRHLNSRIEEHI
ncbi:hypothetical protein EG68_01412 [Paragonimus skrjabini miyazakii]|uniref:Uncharacterized protein n=1 Tax=Paragonimus skrjabini miyazakii TaxID=59628 RepID=A0A8S9Z1B5_9TREM|nr:hypothetical protein EG68_01412 [Paragonimus skrjabini miyazakii]